MKLNWFSPLPPQQSEIAYYAERTVAALAEQAEVVLWTDQGKIDRSIRKDFEVRRFNPRRTDWKVLNAADATLYHIGNDARFHASIWEISRRHPGIVVLHDARLQHLFGGIFLGQRRDPQAYLRAMEMCYGSEGRRAAQEYLDHSDKDSYILDLAARFPLTELATGGALGVLVHTKPVYEQLRQQLLCACAYAPLPYPSPEQPARESRSPVVGDVRKLIVFGYLGPNRRIEPLLRALAGMHERDRLHLDIYGKLWDVDRVNALLREMRLTRSVKVRGYVSESELEAALAKSDLAINLRYPTMGEASSSQLRIWSHALPTLVTDVDWYATLPAEAVARVRIERETEDIQRHLRTLLDDPSRFTQMGVAGRRLLAERHAPRDYAAAIIALAKELPALRGRATAFRMAERAASEMRWWSEGISHPANTTAAAASVGRAIFDLTASESSAAEDTP